MLKVAERRTVLLGGSCQKCGHSVGILHKVFTLINKTLKTRKLDIQIFKFLGENRTIIQQIVYTDLSIFVHLQTKCSAGVGKFCASGSILRKLHFIGQNLDFFAKIDVADLLGETACNAAHKLRNRRATCRVGSEFGDFDFAVFNGLRAVAVSVFQLAQVGQFLQVRNLIWSKNVWLSGL